MNFILARAKGAEAIKPLTGNRMGQAKFQFMISKESAYVSRRPGISRAVQHCNATPVNADDFTRCGAPQLVG